MSYLDNLKKMYSEHKAVKEAEAIQYVIQKQEEIAKTIKDPSYQPQDWKCCR